MSGIIAFFRASPPKAGAAFDEHRFRRVRWQTFIAMTLAYVTFYVCRLSFTVAKSALVELGITPTELGMIGSTLFFSYAIGKLVNGFIADHANVVRYMSLGLLLSAGMNLMMGMTTNALLLAIFWGINGWAQSMGVGPCAVSLARWYGVKERGTFYGIWSTAHNIGEAVTYMVIAAVIAGFGWQMGYLSTAALGAAGVVLLVKAEMADEVAARVEDAGVFVVPKPLNRALLFGAVKLAQAANRRIMGLQRQNNILQQKIDDIRLVDRAKCALIQYRLLTEPEAHKYIEREAMDSRRTRREVAQAILRMYEGGC